MHDLVWAIAARIERAADRASNAGHTDSERRLRAAAVSIRERGDVAFAAQTEREVLSAVSGPVAARIEAYAATSEYDPPTISSATGSAIAQEAATLITTTYAGVTYGARSNVEAGGTTQDCSGFVIDVLNQSGLKISSSLTTTDIASSSQFTVVPPGQQQAGDVMVVPPPPGGTEGHMGIYTGQQDATGRPYGTQMGNHGPATIPWGPTTVPGTITYYRPNK